MRCIVFPLHSLSPFWLQALMLLRPVLQAKRRTESTINLRASLTLLGIAFRKYLFLRDLSYCFFSYLSSFLLHSSLTHISAPKNEAGKRYIRPAFPDFFRCMLGTRSVLAKFFGTSDSSLILLLLRRAYLCVLPTQCPVYLLFPGFLILWFTYNIVRRVVFFSRAHTYSNCLSRS